MEMVTTRGDPEVMLKQETYSLLVQVIWTLKQRACGNMLVRDPLRHVATSRL